MTETQNTKPARKSRTAELVYVEGVGTTLAALPAKRKPVAKMTKAEIAAEDRAIAKAEGAAGRKPVAKKPVAKKPAAKKPAAKVTAPAAPVTGFDAEAVAKRIADLRAEGIAWRPLSATLNAEGITTIRGKQWSANGSTAFLFAGKRGIK